MLARAAVGIALTICAGSAWARAQSKPSAPPASPHTAPARSEHPALEPYTPSSAIPILARTALKPPADREGFESTAGFIVFRGPRPERAAPFATEAEAVAAARGWVMEHFGEMPAGHALVVTEVKRRTSESFRLLNSSAPDWVISLRECYRGIPTMDAVDVDLIGSTVTMAHLTLGHYAPIPGTEKPIISADAARKAFLDLIPGDAPYRDAVAAEMRPLLMFTWSHAGDVPGQTIEGHAPTWCIGDPGRLTIDAQTGSAKGEC